MLVLDGTADDTVAALLGLDRADHFAHAEREHPDGLAVVWPSSTATSLPLFVDFELRPLPWDALRWPPAIDLALFVHRVQGLASGIYLLAREPMRAAALKAAMHDFFEWKRPRACPAELPLFLLEEGDARQMTIDVSCHQEIAGDGCFHWA
jgi:hypothetical protein